MITIKSDEEIKILREGGKALAEILQKVAAAAQQGVSTHDLDKIAERLILAAGGEPVFKGYTLKGVKNPYPSCLCVSLNDEVVHGIPKSDRFLKEGDIVGLDIGMRFGGLVTDTAVTVGVGSISEKAERLIRATKEALEIGIQKVRQGATIGDISFVIEHHLKKNKLGIIRDLAGHGVGYELHEDPYVPNYGTPGTGLELKNGMVIAIEPMATLGGWQIALQGDGWTIKTFDGSLSAHFEHTVAVAANGVLVLTE